MGPRLHPAPLAVARRGIAVLGSACCYVLDRTIIDELTTLRRLYFDDKNLIDKKLVQLYHLPPADRKRKRSGDESDDETDPSDQKKLAAKTDDHGTAQNVRRVHVENAQDAHVWFPATATPSHPAAQRGHMVRGPEALSNITVVK